MSRGVSWAVIGGLGLVGGGALAAVPTPPWPLLPAGCSVTTDYGATASCTGDTAVADVPRPAGWVWGPPTVGRATLSYQFEVDDPNNPLVQGALTYLLFARAVGAPDAVQPVPPPLPWLPGQPEGPFPLPFVNAATASLEIASWIGTAFSDSVAASIDGPGLSQPRAVTATLNRPLSLQTGVVYTITLAATAAVNIGGSAYAYADPLITIDPTLYPSASLVFSAGAVNHFTGPSGITVVPEPAGAAMLVLGMLTLGLRRRRP